MGKEKGVIRTISKSHFQKAEKVTWNTTKGSADVSAGGEMKLYGKGGVNLKDNKEVKNKATIEEPGSAENIIVIGPQRYIHDPAWGGVRSFFRSGAGPNGKFMFIHQAMRKIFLNPEINWTVITYTTGYTEKQLTAMEVAILSKVTECRFVRVNVYDHVFNYINTMDFNDWTGNVSKLRKKNKIRRIHFYCHGLVFRLAMGITNQSTTDDDLDITTGNISKIKKEAFEQGSKIYSFSCRTGLGNENINSSVYYEETVSTGWFTSKKVTKQYNLYSAQSLAQKMANATEATVYAYLRRSEYSDTLNTSDELDFLDAYDFGLKKIKKRERKNYDYLTNPSNAKDEDKRKYIELDGRRKRRKTIDNGLFDSAGAVYPVRAASTPEGLPSDMKTFKKI